MQEKVLLMQQPLSQMAEVQAQIQSFDAIKIAPNPITTPQAQAVDFTQVITNTLNNVDQQGRDASAKMTAVDTGQSDDLVGAMVASQKASLAFSAMVQVRNKLMTAYDDVMKMPV
ncbi:flagellar basal body protein FliE [Photobacterium jeanii]|uniref:Flagellar hook-basal body complex protein FliE n=1 Tax=Photobacterium jeanii TaxID=858640 RepID=A0A178KJF8_9GAMM|nr:flagellar hook-basal body complex protein FliE [Photobacterium jeanii]OAN16702.1 flagellar basal body protein FliE [Photobacterium jeanii]PST87431.1 flagellar hook-basal body complex protein FliE [Photobacterium jeanii]